MSAGGAFKVSLGATTPSPTTGVTVGITDGVTRRQRRRGSDLGRRTAPAPRPTSVTSARRRPR